MRGLLTTGVLAILGACSLLATAPTDRQDGGVDPDRLYEEREDLNRARQAADIWAARLARNPNDFESAWKLARAAYWLGSHVSSSERRYHYERGLDAGRRAIELEPSRPEGRFWTGATMGAMAESFGLMTGLRYRGAVKREFEAVLATHPSFSEGAADRGLGRWYFKVPGLFGGSRQKAIEHLERSLTYNPANAASHFFLAEVYQAMNRPADIRRHLEQVLAAPEDAAWGPEVREFKRKARVMLAELEPR